ncbi:hypothetical protein PR048_027356 [Dryococelus australis]|uniref:Uncharacterized protein n=1 Tax=Dryococelus australis TaxID=614101 RepID=A0ABQ9GFN1_9NEOP|nr:hypothetical protein PR048_027356 [Dryococelus australis]
MRTICDVTEGRLLHFLTVVHFQPCGREAQRDSVGTELSSDDEGRSRRPDIPIFSDLLGPMARRQDAAHGLHCPTSAALSLFTGWWRGGICGLQLHNYLQQSRPVYWINKCGINDVPKGKITNEGNRNHIISLSLGISISYPTCCKRQFRYVMSPSAENVKGVPLANIISGHEEALLRRWETPLSSISLALTLQNDHIYSSQVFAAVVVNFAGFDSSERSHLQFAGFRSRCRQFRWLLRLSRVEDFISSDVSVVVAADQQMKDRSLKLVAWLSRCSGDVGGRTLVLCLQREAGPPLDHTVFGTSWRTLAQSPPSTVTADNQWAVDIGIFVHNAANRVESPAGSLVEFRMWEPCHIMPLVAGFSRESPVSPALSFRPCSVPTLIGSQDLDVKSRPNLFTRSLSNALLKIYLYAHCVFLQQMQDLLGSLLLRGGEKTSLAVGASKQPSTLTPACARTLRDFEPAAPSLARPVQQPFSPPQPLPFSKFPWTTWTRVRAAGNWSCITATATRLSSSPPHTCPASQCQVCVLTAAYSSSAHVPNIDLTQNNTNFKVIWSTVMNVFVYILRVGWNPASKVKKRGSDTGDTNTHA